VQCDQTLCTESTDDSVSVMDECGLIPHMGRSFSFATSFRLVMRPAQYPIQLTHNVLLPGNKAIGNEAKNPESSTLCLFYRVPEHRGYNGRMQTICAIKLYDDTTRGTLFRTELIYAWCSQNLLPPSPFFYCNLTLGIHV
jgi:hypothetical protein